MIRTSPEGLVVERPVSRRLGESPELCDGDLVPANVERRKIHRPLRPDVGPALGVEGQSIDRRVTSHQERPGRNLDEAEELLVREEPGIRAKPGEIRRTGDLQRRAPRVGRWRGPR